MSDEREQLQFPYFTRLYQEAFSQPQHHGLGGSSSASPAGELNPFDEAPSQRRPGDAAQRRAGDASEPGRRMSLSSEHSQPWAPDAEMSGLGNKRRSYTTTGEGQRGRVSPGLPGSARHAETGSGSLRPGTSRLSSASHRGSAAMDTGTVCQLEAEKRLLTEELEKYKNLCELKSLVEAQKDEDIQLLQKQLEMARRAAESNSAINGQTTIRTERGWDLTGLLRESARNWTGRSHSIGSDSNNVENRSKDLEIQKLREGLEARSKHIIQLQTQLEDMENYLNKEREAFQSEVDQRNRKIQEIKAGWEREKDVSATIMQHKMELMQQIEQHTTELERREPRSWVLVPPFTACE
eukprot:Gregarina_sp_Poly_1__10944@NODE_860_length_5945_cov_36_349779_g622_i0_p3_GENE_NODE_860_length_5945_cov_36_349779_g622_i0NODE_860_length_5945_cov_36_349779_g622_i0_p3_ORF_typecomplete_len352_score56_87DUF812/PF05667_11/4_3DUF812/PF05667_11/0_0023LemA/PF04011_12/2_7e02LemA/PF04011_12/0_0008LemA/PF04011_12/8_3e03Bacillus_HBL/PF05791_11/4_7e02Bacillus_HBL/PF05791_11/0_0025Filament/PF00038_21/0_58DUF4515/PF14988_6/6_2DUF4515/PF14988_6/0_084AAA_15/PF13175_6/0_043HMMR_N/PF15905_5/2_8e02HMMR_N/PF15905_5